MITPKDFIEINKSVFMVTPNNDIIEVELIDSNMTKIENEIHRWEHHNILSSRNDVQWRELDVEIHVINKNTTDMIVQPEKLFKTKHGAEMAIKELKRNQRMNSAIQAQKTGSELTGLAKEIIRRHLQTQNLTPTETDVIKAWLKSK